MKYYVDLINEAYKRGKTYKPPTSAKEYFSTGKRQNYGRYDFIVIGSGSGGATAASRLSEVEDWNVLVLEAGCFGNNFSDIPNMYIPIQFTHFNWGYKSIPQKTACLGLEDEECPYPRGKGVGGTTLINGLVYARGHKDDFNRWGKIAGNDRWSYPSVLQYFKKSENFVHRDPEAPVDPEFHGKGGPLRVEYHLKRSPQLNAFLEANKEIGYDVVDYNANKVGASPSQLNTINGRRFDNGKAFLTPNRNRTNLKILTQSYVTRLRIDKKNKRVTGVEFSHQGKNHFVEAIKEVILCAGAISTPQILMQSGIGPKKHLKEVGIDIVQDLEVGSTLYDNPTFFGINFGTNYTEPIKPLSDYVREFLNGVGPLTLPGSNGGVGFYESSYTKGTGVPDIELMMIPANATNPLSKKSFNLKKQTYEDLWKNINPAQSFILYIVTLHAQSSGTIRLKSKDFYQYPLINSKFLSDPENRDINVLYEAIQLGLKLVDTKAFKAMDTKLQGGPLRVCKHLKYLSKAYWYCALRELSVNLYHPVGSCPMGTVVDSKLKVFGIDNLRIADASVIPFALAGHPNAPTVMVGEQLGDLVKSSYNIQI